jgi:ABC-type nitrate/sulfonate/bicarbonate transport system permease component
VGGSSGEVAALKSDFRTTTWPPILVCQVPRHVLRDVKTWRGFDASSFGRIFHQWWITVSRACSGLLSGCANGVYSGMSSSLYFLGTNAISPQARFVAAKPMPLLVIVPKNITIRPSESLVMPLSRQKPFGSFR